ncbi:MAG: peroxiredoxin [Cyclobacteriaceae bacterium]
MSLEKGELIPDITLKNQFNKDISLREAIGKNIVVYFYPKDFTPGCTKEACSFRDNYNIIKEYDAEIFGISNDAPDRHHEFAKAYNLEYMLLSDQYRKAEKAFEVQRNLFGMLPGRETFVFDKEGKLVGSFSSALAATRHVEEAIALLENL